MRILVTDGMDKTALAQLKANGHDVVEQFYEPDALGAALKEFDVCVVRSATKVRAQHIDQAKEGRLKLIIRGGVGVDNIDVKYAEDNGITVRNTPRPAAIPLRNWPSPIALLRPVCVRCRPHHAGRQVGKESLWQGH